MKRSQNRNCVPAKNRVTGPAETDVGRIRHARRVGLRFIATFLAVVAAFYVITLPDWVDRHVLFPVMEISARGASWLLNLGGAHTILDGVCIRGANFSVAVRRGCDPIEPIVLLSAALLAFPSSWPWKAYGFLFGAIALFVLNLIRIASLYLAGEAQVPWFESLHQEWWPAFFILAALLIWFGWLRIKPRSGVAHA
jgi:exosortase H (IPTLxxWG-CTERM-specific)